MTRLPLEHIIRAAAGTADVNDIIVIGSQAVLGTYPNAPAELTESMKADVFPKMFPTGRSSSTVRSARSRYFIKLSATTRMA